MRTRPYIGCFLALCLAAPTSAVPISIVPEVGLGGFSSAPFASDPSTVVQQFTSSALFAALGGPAQLLSLDFSSPTIGTIGTPVVTTNSIAAGFTTVPLASLTATMATNLSNPLTTVATNYNLVPQAGPTFNWHIDFSTPIVYDPSQGNLVLQFTKGGDAGVLINAFNTPTSRTVFSAGAPGPFGQARLFQFNFNTLSAGAPELDSSSARLPLCLVSLALLVLAGKRRESQDRETLTGGAGSA
ncbi:MAG: hypothetical protein U0931_38780 [Vulcanimicrobiota bacterium]